MIETRANGAYPHVEVDDVVGAIYITLQDDTIASSCAYDNGAVVVDLNADGEAVGIEILKGIN